MKPAPTSPAAARFRRTGAVLVLALLALLAPRGLAAQQRGGVSKDLLARVLPGAERFTDKAGKPPVFRGYVTDPATGKDVLVGLAFLTSDVPPEEEGYAGPIQVLVGIDPQGVLTGIVVTEYHESLMRSRGDFLSEPGFQEQFAGKPITDAFRVHRDVDGISGATITVTSMSRGIRNAARKVWASYFGKATRADEAFHDVKAEELEDASWLELSSRGLVQKMDVLEDGVSRIQISLLRIRNDDVGQALLGPGTWQEVVEKAGERLVPDHVWMLGVDGGLSALFRASAFSLVQGDDTVKLRSGAAVMAGSPREGLVDGQFRDVGILMVDTAVDVRRPFTFVFDLNNDMGTYTVRYPGEARAVVASRKAPSAAGDAKPGSGAAPAAREGQTGAAEGAAGEGVATGAEGEAAAERNGAPGVATGEAAGERTAAAAGGGTSAERSGATQPGAEADAVTEGAPAGQSSSAGADTAAGPAARPMTPALTFTEPDEGSVLSRTLAETSWPRVAGLALLLALATCAFVMKRRTWLRELTLVATIGYLGFGGGGFLSVSHLMSVIEVGPGVLLENLPLLLLVGFTVLTTLLWGRVFCGYLCPFGALQDLLDRVVPARFKRELPRALHQRATLVKYGVLAVVLLPAAVGSSLSLFQYVEPFGTVFFLSTSVVLWSIALFFLGAAAVVPRFYCRYVCPLGASLALGSLVSPFRIRRVEQCGVCKVCEGACPTGAIHGPEVDFKECVRCNVCEINLEEKAGVCRHDMDEVNRRLVPLTVGGRRGART